MDPSELLPSSKNFTDLRVENIMPPKPRKAATSATTQMHTDVALDMKTGGNSVANAVEQVYRDWIQDITHKPATNTPYKRLEARVYKEVRKLKTPTMTIDRGRQLLVEAQEPGMKLADMLLILQSITAAVRCCGARGVRAPPWPSKSLDYCPRPEKALSTKRSVDDDDGDTTATDDDDVKPFKPLPPIHSSVPPPRKRAFKSSGNGGPAVCRSVAPYSSVHDDDDDDDALASAVVQSQSLGPTGHELWARATNIDAAILTKWAQTHNTDAVEWLLRQHTHELDALDRDLVETYEQLTYSMLLNRLFHEQRSTTSHSKPSDVAFVFELVLKGCISGETLRGYPMYDPVSPISQALLEIARNLVLWRAFLGPLTFHLRHDPAMRAETKNELAFKRSIFLMEALPNGD